MSSISGAQSLLTRREVNADLGSLGGSVVKELEAFSLQLATNKREIVTFAPLKDSEALSLGLTAQYGTTEEEAARLTGRLVSEVPALKKELVQPDVPNATGFERAPIEIERSVLGLWRWVVDGRPVYILQTLLGTARPGVTIALRELERRGYVTHGRGLVTIIDRDGLVKSFNGAYVVRDAK